MPWLLGPVMRDQDRRRKPPEPAAMRNAMAVSVLAYPGACWLLVLALENRSELSTSWARLPPLAIRHRVSGKG